jgi:SpoIID/LytB domain protein
MGQYGALGYAVDHGWSTQKIINYYYAPGSLATDGGNPSQTVEISAVTGSVTEVLGAGLAVNGTTINAPAVRLVRDGSDQKFNVYTGTGCSPSTWTKHEALNAKRLAEAEITTTETSDISKMLRVCQSGNDVAYRGKIVAKVGKNSAGAYTSYTVNVLPMQSYLRGVVPRESPASWADVGGGKGAAALRAQAVAARSYAMSENRSTYYKTCDTTSCQVYKGAGWFVDDKTFTVLEDSRSNKAIDDTNGWYVKLGGKAARTEFSSSTGGWTAGGTFNAVQDQGDGIASNPNRNWSATMKVTDIASALGVGTLSSIAITGRNGLGADGGRVTEVTVKSGSTTKKFTGNEIRSKLGLKSDWFTFSAIQLPNPPGVSRVSGADRYATAAAISAQHYSAKAPVVYITSGENFPDALVGGAVAAQQNAPLLLTTPRGIPAVTASELKRLQPATIVILGGKSAVTAAVATALAPYASTGKVSRISGADRYETSAKASSATFAPNVANVLIATGANYADATVGAPAAARHASPVLLVPPTGSIPAPVAAELKRLQPKAITILGGTASVSTSIEKALKAFSPTVGRWAGANRYATAAVVGQQKVFSPVSTVYIATGENYPDALAGAAAAGMKGAPILTVAARSLPSATASALKALKPTRIVVLGGTASISGDVLQQLGGYIK